MNTKNILIIVMVITVIGVGLYVWNQKMISKEIPIENVDSIKGIDEATKQDTTITIEENISNTRIESTTESELELLDKEIEKL